MIQGHFSQLELYPDLLMKYSYEERQSTLALVEAEECPHLSIRIRRSASYRKPWKRG